MAVKYREYFKKMLDENKEVFESFKTLHDKYSLKQDTLQNKFNREGENILEIIHEYENRLCANTERGMYNKFSSSLAEKFQNEVRKHFPMIDHIGLKVETIPLKSKAAKDFIIKKIKLL